MIKECASLAKQIAKDFSIQTCGDCAIGCALIIIKRKINLNDPILKRLFKELIINNAKINAASATTFYSLNFALEKSLNPNRDFSRMIAIKTASSVAASAVSFIIQKEKSPRKIIIYLSVSALQSIILTILYNWENGGKQFVKRKFPDLYHALSKNKVFKQMIQMNQMTHSKYLF